jgi:zinc/manganese transport system substrate-binding protein
LILSLNIGRVSRALAVVLLPLGMGLVLLGCGTAPAPATARPGTLGVVTTSSVFADLIRNAGGDRVTVTSLVPKGADIHTYQATPADLRAVAHADLIVMNGLGLDDWLTKTLTAASSGATVVRLGVDLPGVTLLPGETAGTENPHLWMDVGIAELYVTRISDALQAADPTHADAIAASTAAYQGTLHELDTWIRQQIASIPTANRKIVLFHPALPYYARAYGLTIVGVAVHAPGQDPSAGEIAALIDAIRAAGVRAIFSEAQFPTTLVDQLAHDTGAKVVADLYDDTLGDPPVTSYEAMMHWDTDQLVSALR